MCAAQPDSWITPSRVAATSGPQDFETKGEWVTLVLLDSIAEEWRTLCDEGPCNEPFFRPEWIAAAVKAFAGGQRLLLITVRSAGRLRAVLPLLETKRRSFGIPVICLRGASYLPRFNIVHGDGADVADALRALWIHLRNLPGWEAIELSNVPQGGAAERLLEAVHSDSFPTLQYKYFRTPCLRLNELKPGHDFSRFGRTSRFRGQLRQGWRELGKQGPLHLRRLERVRAEDVRRFYRLEQSGWKGREGTAILDNKQDREFFDGVVSCAERFGYLSMYFLEVGDVAVAAHLGLTHAGRYYPFKVAYDENYSQYRPGHLLNGRVIEDCLSRGISEVDFLGYWDEAKAKWTSDSRPHIAFRIFRRSTLGRVLWVQHNLVSELRKVIRSNQGLRRVIRSARSFYRVQKNRFFSTTSNTDVA